MILKGRRKIMSEYSLADMKDINKLKQAIHYSYQTHQVNRTEIRYLMDYKNGEQEILNKVKEVRPEINNMLVVNHAQMITRSITGYFLGTPIQYTQARGDNKEAIDTLNQALLFEDKASVDKDIAEYQSICGVGYRVIYTDGEYGDEVPFEDKALNPENTFVVYENKVAEKPLFGVNYTALYDGTGAEIGYKIYCYTDHGLYTFISESFDLLHDTNEEYYSPYAIGGVPIIEYPNNIWRLGDWELVIGVMEAYNTLQSGRLDDIDQLVQSLLVFVNADIDKEIYDEMREAGVIILKNSTTNKTDVKVMNNALDQTGVAQLAGELKDLIYALIGIPDRNNKSAGGGDTGQAVELRDGWADLEIVARNKELTFKRAEKQSLKIMLTILNSKMGVKLSLMDINIKFSRNKNNNLLVKTQAYSNLIATKTLDPADCLTIVDLVSDVPEYVSRGRAFWGEDFAGKATDMAQNEPPSEPKIDDKSQNE